MAVSGFYFGSLHLKRVIAFLFGSNVYHSPTAKVPLNFLKRSFSYVTWHDPFLLFSFIIVIFLTMVKYETTPYHTYCKETEENVMIDYSPFWITLECSSETTYTLINKHHISSAIIDKLRKNKPMNTTTLNDLCRILNCRLDEIAQYIPSETDQPL